MKKILAIICILILVVVSIAPTVASSDFTIIVNKSNTKLTVPLNEIHITGGDEQEYNGPSSFLIKNDEIYILDSVSSEIKIYNNNKLYSTLKLPEEYYFIDMDIFGDTLYLLDTKYRIVEYDIYNLSNVVLLNIPKLPELSFSAYIGGKTITGNYEPRYINFDKDIHIMFENNKEYIFDGINLTPHNKMNLRLENNSAQVNTETKTIQLETMGSPVSVRHMYTDQNGNDFIKVDSAYQDNNGKVYIEECIHQFKINNKIFSATLENNGFYTPNRNVYIDKSGEIYQMIISNSGLSIMQLEKQKNYKQKYNLQKSEDYKESQTAQPVKNSANVTSTQQTSWPVVTKSQLEAVVNSYVNLQWTYNKSTNGNINRVSQANRQYVLQPRTLTGYTDTLNHTISKMPYCWGGFDLPSNFITKINGTSYYAGNINNQTTDIVPNTAGVDCSGFVCRAFLLTSKRGTGTDPTWGMRPVDNSGPFITDSGTLDKYDVWISNGHTMLHYSRVYDVSINGYYVYESTTKDSIDECRFNFHDFVYLNKFSLYKYINFNPNN